MINEFAKSELEYINFEISYGFDKKYGSLSIPNTFGPLSSTKLLGSSNVILCAIERIDKLIENNVYKGNEILFLTTNMILLKTFIDNIKKYDKKRIDVKCGRTFGKFSLQTIYSTKILDLYTFDFSTTCNELYEYLEKTDSITLRKTTFEKIKAIFVYDAKYLNDIEYKILNILHNKLGIVINLIGIVDDMTILLENKLDLLKKLKEFDAITFCAPGILSLEEFSNIKTNQFIDVNKLNELENDNNKV